MELPPKEISPTLTRGSAPLSPTKGIVETKCSEKERISIEREISAAEYHRIVAVVKAAIGITPQEDLDEMITATEHLCARWQEACTALEEHVWEHGC